METMYENFKRIKMSHPYTVLLFRDGKTYRAFDDDAELLGTLGAFVAKLAGGTRRASCQERELDPVLRHIVRTGRGVAICEPVENPKTNQTSE